MKAHQNVFINNRNHIYVEHTFASSIHSRIRWEHSLFFYITTILVSEIFLESIFHHHETRFTNSHEKLQKESLFSPCMLHSATKCAYTERSQFSTRCLPVGKTRSVGCWVLLWISPIVCLVFARQTATLELNYIVSCCILLKAEYMYYNIATSLSCHDNTLK